MAEGTTQRWKFLTNHAQVLVCIAHDPGVLLREISEQVGITERAAHRIVTELATGGYIKRERNGRRNQYTIQSGVALPDRLGRVKRVGDLLTVLTDATGGSPDSTVSPVVKNGKAARSRV
jgi:DNA-binding IclR family transcriptional regulator